MGGNRLYDLGWRGGGGVGNGHGHRRGGGGSRGGGSGRGAGARGGYFNRGGGGGFGRENYTDGFLLGLYLCSFCRFRRHGGGRSGRGGAGPGRCRCVIGHIDLSPENCWRKGRVSIRIVISRIELGQPPGYSVVRFGSGRGVFCFAVFFPGGLGRLFWTTHRISVPPSGGDSSCTEAPIMAAR